VEPREAKDRLEKLLAQAPKREEFQSEEEFQEATVGFRHRAGPIISIYQSLVNRAQSNSQASEK